MEAELPSSKELEENIFLSPSRAKRSQFFQKDSLGIMWIWTVPYFMD